VELLCVLMEKQRLVVLSHNLGCHWFSPNDLPKAFERLDHIATQIGQEHVDLVLVQELYTLATPWPFGWGRELASFKKLLSSLGLTHHIGDGQAPWIGMDSGLQIFSRFPITPTESKLWGKAVKSARGFIGARIDISSGVSLHVLNLHLDAMDSVARKAQYFAVAETASKLVTQGHTVLVAGDFNHTVRSLPGAPDDAFVALAPPGVSTHCHDAQLDQAFITTAAYRAGADVVKWRTPTELPVSDHYGLLLRVGLPEPVEQKSSARPRAVTSDQT
jgi:endonuclease/exonuclease/phosphatase family metal-dependent hydrolase